MPVARITPERVAAIERAAKAGCTDEDIAAIVGVSMAVLARPKIAAGIARARAEAGAMVGAKLLAKAVGGHVGAMIFWLKARHGWRDTDADLERKALEASRRTPRVLIIEGSEALPPPTQDVRPVSVEVQP